MVKPRKRPQKTTPKSLTGVNKRQKVKDEAREALKAEKEARETLKELKKMSFAQATHHMAELCESIIENPQEALSANVHSLLYLATKRDDTQHAATLSLLAVFCDILPSYRIRLPTEQELSVKASKEVQRLRDYESTLLKTYQEYLRFLESQWKQHEDVACMLCLCQLLQKAYTFNFCNNLMEIIAQSMHLPSVSEACCNAMQTVLTEDAQGTLALAATRHICKAVRQHQHAASLATLQRLPLRVHTDEAQAAKIATAARKQARKRNQERAAIERELEHGVDKIQLARHQSDTLQTLVTTYFWVLKKKKRPLLPTALEGLARFAHLIHLETVVDLLEHLKQVLEEDIDVDVALHCVRTAFLTLEGPGKSLQVDYKEYLIPLYAQVLRVNSSTCKVLQECLRMAFLDRREYSNVRVAAFFKRMLTTCLHAPSASTAVPLLALARQLLQKYPVLEQLLDDEVVTRGEYNPDATDPEHANPMATQAWELGTLSRHHDSRVASQAKSFGKLLQLPKESPDRLYKELSYQEEQSYVAYTILTTKAHPLAAKAGDKKPRKRFLRPKFTDNLVVAEVGKIESAELRAFEAMLNAGNKQ